MWVVASVMCLILHGMRAAVSVAPFSCVLLCTHAWIRTMGAPFTHQAITASPRLAVNLSELMDGQTEQ